MWHSSTASTLTDPWMLSLIHAAGAGERVDSGTRLPCEASGSCGGQAGGVSVAMDHCVRA